MVCGLLTLNRYTSGASLLGDSAGSEKKVEHSLSLRAHVTNIALYRFNGCKLKLSERSTLLFYVEPACRKFLTLSAGALERQL